MGVGSALARVDPEQRPAYFAALKDDVEQGTDTAEAFVSRERLGRADDAVIGLEPSVEVELLRAALKAPLDFHLREFPRFGGDCADVRRGIGPRRKVRARF